MNIKFFKKKHYPICCYLQIDNKTYKYYQYLINKSFTIDLLIELNIKFNDNKFVIVYEDEYTNFYLLDFTKNLHKILIKPIDNNNFNIITPNESYLNFYVSNVIIFNNNKFTIKDVKCYDISKELNDALNVLKNELELNNFISNL